MWQLFHRAQLPFGDVCSPSQLKEVLRREHTAPLQFRGIVPPHVKTLIESMCSLNPHNRPSAASVCRQLYDMIPQEDRGAVDYLMFERLVGTHATENDTSDSVSQNTDVGVDTSFSHGQPNLLSHNDTQQVITPKPFDDTSEVELPNDESGEKVWSLCDCVENCAIHLCAHANSTYELGDFQNMNMRIGR